MSKEIKQPIPQGKYLAAIRNADLIYSSGMTPRKEGNLIYSGKISSNSTIESNRDAVILATSNALTAIEACLEDGEKISLILQLNIYINSDDGFKLHSRIADIASEFLIVSLGELCIGSRVAVGVSSLPSNASIEVSMVGKATRVKD